MREGMGMDNRVTRAGGAPDLVITNVTVIDAVLGIVKPTSASKMDASVRSARPAIRTRWIASHLVSRSDSQPTPSRARI